MIKSDYKPRAIVSIQVTCEAGHTATVDQNALSTDGGCSGHDRESYCYCPGVQIIVEWQCPVCLCGTGKHRRPVYHRVELT